MDTTEHEDSGMPEQPEPDNAGCIDDTAAVQGADAGSDEDEPDAEDVDLGEDSE